MKNTSPFQTQKVERDPNIFVWFMTLVIVGMYIFTLRNESSVRPLGILIPFSILTLVHILLHFQLGKIVENTTKILARVFWYILIQGLLAFVISAFAQNIGMVLALFMGLLGEGIGIFGLTRRGLFASVYYLALLAINFIQISGFSTMKSVILTIVPTSIFVVFFVTLYMRQNNARERAQKLASELERANRQLSEYAAQVEDLTIANERQRMARELHDTLSQGLAGIILQLEATEAHLGNQRIEKAQTIVSDMMQQARATLSAARNAIDDLRQPSLDDLDSALRLEISRFTDATGIPCDYHAERTPPLLDSVKETIIRAVAEALTNVARHAQAQQVAVNLSLTDKSLLVTVQDDGQGFDTQKIPSGHYGLLGIRERIRLVDGDFHIQSEKSKGTKLEIEIPLVTSEIKG